MSESVPAGTLTMPVDFFLLPIDPARGFAAVRAEFERLAEADPRLGQAAEIVEARLRSIPSKVDRESTLAPLAWMQLREHLRSNAGVYSLSHSLRDGDAVLRAVQNADATILQPDVLQQTIDQANQLAGAGTAGDDVLAAARAELGQAARAHERTVLFDEGSNGGAVAYIALVVVFVVVVVAAVIASLLK